MKQNINNRPSVDTMLYMQKVKSEPHNYLVSTGNTCFKFKYMYVHTLLT